MKGIDYLIPS